MSRTPRLTDAVLRAALMPAPEVSAPPGLLAAVAAEARSTPQERSRLRFPWALEPPSMLATPRGRQLVLVIASVGLLAALLGGTLVGARLLAPPAPRSNLVPTGIETLATEGGFVERVIVDGVGGHWAIAPGRLTRFDLGTGQRRSWTVTDDAVFGGSMLAAAREGGIWIGSAGVLVRFDGDQVAASVPAPFAGAPDELVELPDGTMWASSRAEGVARWDGVAWAKEPSGRPAPGAYRLLVATDGSVWVANAGQESDGTPTTPGVSHLVDGRWITYEGSDARTLAFQLGGLQEAADGSIWASGENQAIVRFDGAGWSAVDGPGFPTWRLAAVADGSVWAVTSQLSTLAVARYRDGAWTTFGAADGLAGTELSSLSATPAGVFLGTDAGLFRFRDERWSQVWPAAASAPGWGAAPLAVSRDEAWAAGDGIWHLVGGSWEGPLHPTGLEPAEVRALALGPAGELWAATDEGVAVLRDGRWTVAWKGKAWTLAVGPDGTAWVGGDGLTIVEIPASGKASDVREISCPVPASSLAAAPDGSVYLGGFQYASPSYGLARFDGTSCELLDPLGDGTMPDVVGLAAHPDGGVVAALLLTTAGYPGGDRWTSLLARVDGDQVRLIERRENVEGAMAGLFVSEGGDIWRRSWDRRGIERFDGERWTIVIDGVEVVGPVAVAPDGAVYFVGLAGLQRYVPPVEP
jgi:hypothetical protein